MASNLTSEYIQGKIKRTAASEAMLAETHERYFEHLSGFAKPPDRTRLLDVACGTGTWASYAALRGYRVHCIDVQAEFAAAAKVRAHEHGADLWAVQANGLRLPYRDEVFDVVTAFSVLEHVPDWETMIAEALRVLKPGGVLWLTTTNRMCPRTDEIAGFPMFPWYPSSVQRRVMQWAAAHRPHLIGYSPAPAVHWFTYGALMTYLAQRGCREQATLVDYLNPKLHGWRSVTLELLRASLILRSFFWCVQPCVSLMVRKDKRRTLNVVPRVSLLSIGQRQAEWNELLACPECSRSIMWRGERDLHCPGCGRRYRIQDGVPVLMNAQASPETRNGDSWVRTAPSSP